ncbi:hypothetical protein L3081_09455 [Colwellia sp. MSW7]|uniref:Uncharacterized protein n=1 Tax=Colwellia maritima TaxID=2912588 RepID=A0ABS9X1B0_9GAMM|nr:hypothetical protein [Colwellia maritima]
MDKQKLTEKLQEYAVKPEYLMHEKIKYLAWLAIVEGGQEITHGDGIELSKIDIFSTINANEMLKSIFFKKSIDWSGEEEYRWLLFNETSSDIFIQIHDVIKGVVLGCEFPDNQISQVQAYCKDLMCPCYLLSYQHPKYKLMKISV